MTKNNILFRNFSVIIIALVLFVFFITLFIQQNNYFLTRVLTAMSVSGFAGMFGSFFLTLLDQFLKRNNYNICVLCRKKEFTSSLIQGIQDYLVQKPNAQADFFAYDLADSNSAIETFLKSDAQKYDGVILIPDVTVTEGVYEGIKQVLAEKKPVILLDQNLSLEQQDNLNTKMKPIYICSDFDQGGRAIAEYIRSYVKVNGQDQTRVILLTGPNQFNSLMIRGKSLLYGLGEQDLHRITGIVNLDSMHLEHIEDNIRILSNKINDWAADPFMQLEGKDLLIYCGNDTLANHLMRQMDDKNGDNPIKNYLIKARKIVFIGYDGIQGIDGKYELERFGHPFVTVDVMLKSQGRLSAEILYNIFENRGKAKYRSIELIQPRLVINTDNRAGILNHKTMPYEINQIYTGGSTELMSEEWAAPEFSA